MEIQPSQLILNQCDVSIVSTQFIRFSFLCTSLLFSRHDLVIGNNYGFLMALLVEKKEERALYYDMTSINGPSEKI